MRRPLDEFRIRVEQALRSAYLVERELGGGGMSRTFLATEVALSRKVVIKVLAPELADGINVERFQREILVAAQLQHAHVVPLLTAGDVQGIPWFAMPFVDGPTLRERMAGAAISRAEAIALLRDVGRAMAYAHSRGIVHRDIKPDNVLLSAGTAVVTDFGIAKALSDAIRDNGAHRPTSTLTQVGTAIGTPLYMAPEQAAGDTVDHRADIYAFGAVAYELLCGRAPFADLTGMRLLAAKLAEAPPHLRTVAPALPEWLTSVVMQCLERDPEQRPRDATAILRAFDGIMSGEGIPVPASSVAGVWVSARVGRGAALLLTGFVCAHASVVGFEAPPPDRPRRDVIVVADFAPPGADSMLGPTVSDLLRTDLDRSETVRVLNHELVRSALARMRRDSARTLTFDLAREVAIREGATAVLDGKVSRLGDRYVVSARLVSTAGQREVATFSETADSPDALIVAIGQLARRVRSSVGEGASAIQQSPRLDRVTTPSLTALRLFTQARQVAAEAGDYRLARRLLDEAIALDSGFAMAWRLQAIVARGANDDPARRDLALASAWRYRDRLTERERAVTEFHHFAMGPAPDVARARAVVTEWLGRDSTDVDMRTNLLALHITTGEWDAAVAVGRPLLDLLRNDAHGLLLFGTALLQSGATAEAEQVTALARARFPNHSAALELAVYTFMARDRFDSAEVLLREVRANPASNFNRSLASQLLALLLQQQGRVNDYLSLTADTARERSSTRESKRRLSAATRVDTAYVAALFTGDHEASRAALSRSGATLGSLPDSAIDWGHIGLTAAFAKDASTAAWLRDAYARVTAPNAPNRALYLTWLEGSAALAAERWDAALDRFRIAAGQAGTASLEVPFMLAAAHDGARRADSALYWYRRVADSHDRLSYWAPLRVVAIRRAAALADAAGDVRSALKYYEQLIGLWGGADRSMQHVVQAARARVEALRARAFPG